MKSRASSVWIGIGPWLALLYAGVGYWLLSDQALVFPLGAEEQHRVVAALGSPWEFPSDSWMADVIDPLLARISPPAAYVYLQFIRRLAVVAALVGLGVWVWRSGGWVRGMWVAGLALTFLPIRLVGATLAPQALALPFLVWGWALALGPPWTKTGSLEASLGGALLGLSLFAAPWAWLFALSLPAASLFSKVLRRRLVSGFWISLAAGSIPSLVWWLYDRSGRGRDLGYHPETLVSTKIPQLLELVTVTEGIALVFLVFAGVVGVIRRREEWNRWALLLAWGGVPTLAVGYASPAWAGLAVPGMVLLVAAGLQWMGGIFVSRSEREVIPSLVVILLSHHLFFSALPVIRGQQAFSLEEQGMTRLLAEQVPDDDFAALFRLNRLVAYTETVHKGRDWQILETEFFQNGTPDQVIELVTQFLAIRGTLWIDPKRLGELGESGKQILDGVETAFRVEKRVGNHSVELWRVRLR